MRLRLTVQRNGLPAANILWSVPDTNSGTAYTITRLLEDVNHIIPLEAEHWGLEHYVVEVAGFECLHFSPVVQALKEDDHVSIRPLMTAEVRARTLTGRHQISDDGRHLVDGVPFGKPYLRHPNRPAVRIPPRKRRRLDDAEPEEQSEVMGLLTLSGKGEEDEEESLAAVNEGTNSTSQGSGLRRVSKTVQFKQPDSNGSDESEEEDDEDFAPEADSDSDIAMDDSSESDPESEAASAASSSASDTSDPDSSSDSDSDSENNASSPPDIMSSKLVPPGQGRNETYSRNVRRARSQRLRRLKESGVLHKDADLSDLRKYEDTKRSHSPESSLNSRRNASGKRTRLDDDQDNTTEREELERRKKELIERFNQETATSTMEMPEADPQASIVEPEVAPTLPQPIPEAEPSTQSAPPSKRLRPDTSAISRILARQARPLVKKSKTKPVVEEAPEPDGASDPDFWKSKINLSAFECWDEEFELTAPPFPFQQHWDPASKLMRDKVIKKKQKKGGKNRNSFPVEEEAEEDKIILDYDEVPAIENSDANISAAIEDQLRQDVATAAQIDLPPLPEDISTLAELKSTDIKEGAIIVCKFCDVNPITITPEVSDYKTALVQQEGDSGNGAGTIRLKIAQRDLPKKDVKFDRKGNRLYKTGDRFFMGDEDAEDDEGLWEGTFAQMIEGKLLKAA